MNNLNFAIYLKKYRQRLKNFDIIQIKQFLYFYFAYFNFF